jgi:hypothetical protein
VAIIDRFHDESVQDGATRRMIGRLPYRGLGGVGFEPAPVHHRNGGAARAQTQALEAALDRATLSVLVVLSGVLVEQNAVGSGGRIHRRFPSVGGRAGRTLAAGARIPRLMAPVLRR